MASIHKGNYNLFNTSDVSISFINLLASSHPCANAKNVVPNYNC